MGSTATYDDYLEKDDFAKEHSWDSTLTYKDYPKEDGLGDEHPSID